MAGQLGGVESVRLWELIAEAEEARVIAPVAGMLDRHRFAHALIRETLYTGLPHAARVQLHRQVGEALEALTAADPEPHLAELAHHFVQAAPQAGPERAVAYACRAGDQALASFTYEEAARHYALALGAFDLRPPADAAIAGTHRCALLLAVAEAQRKAGDGPASRETCQQAARIAGRLHAASDAPEHALLLARAALGFGLVWGSEVGFADRVMISPSRRALAALGEAGSIPRARLLARLAKALLHSEPLATIAPLSREAVALARRLSDPATLAVALHELHWTLFEMLDVDQRLEIATEIVQSSEAAGDLEMTATGHDLCLVNLPIRGDLGAADTELAIFARLAEELGVPLLRWRVMLVRVMRALLDGRFDDAEQFTEEALWLTDRVALPDGAGQPRDLRRAGPLPARSIAGRGA